MPSFTHEWDVYVPQTSIITNLHDTGFDDVYQMLLKEVDRPQTPSRAPSPPVEEEDHLDALLDLTTPEWMDPIEQFESLPSSALLRELASWIDTFDPSTFVLEALGDSFGPTIEASVVSFQNQYEPHPPPSPQTFAPHQPISAPSETRPIRPMPSTSPSNKVMDKVLPSGCNTEEVPKSGAMALLNSTVSTQDAIKAPGRDASTTRSLHFFSAQSNPDAPRVPGSILKRKSQDDGAATAICKMQKLSPTSRLPITPEPCFPALPRPSPEKRRARFNTVEVRYYQGSESLDSDWMLRPSARQLSVIC